VRVLAGAALLAAACSPEPGQLPDAAASTTSAATTSFQTSTEQAAITLPGPSSTATSAADAGADAG